MPLFGFNINMKNTPEEIRRLGERYLAPGLYHAIEVTYYEHMEGTDTSLYNQAIMDIVTQYHPRVLVHISGFNLAEESSALRSAILNEIANCVKYTRQLGGKEMVIHSGNIRAGLHVPIVNRAGAAEGMDAVFARSWQLSVAMMKQACLLASADGVTLYTENLNAEHLTQSGETLRKYLVDVDCDNLKIVFDVGHCHHTGHSIPRDIRDAGIMLEHLHIHDNFGQIDEHATPGDGNIDFAEFVSCLEEQHYNGLYMFELKRCTEENLTRCHKMFSNLLRIN